MNLLAELLSSKTRAEVFRLLFGVTEEHLHIRAIERRSGLAIGSVQDETRKLVTLGIVVRRKDGNRTYYEPNKKHPLYPDIRRIVLKTSGLTDILKQALDKATGIQCAFVFGSVAAGTENAESDIDLMVIGSIGLRKLSSFLSGVAEAVGREINPHVMTEDEFGRRRKRKEHLVSRILESQRLFVLGTEDELETMGK
jgi:predicted nucleotidyltransferase